MRVPKVFIGAFVVCLVSGAVFFLYRQIGRGDADLSERLRERGTIAVMAAEGLRRISAHGTEFIPVEKLPEIERAINEDSAVTLLAVMTKLQVAGLLVEGRLRDRVAGGSRETATLAQRLAAYDHVPALKAEFLSPAAGFYVPDTVEPLSSGSQRALAVVARRLLAGATPARTAAFPEPLRRIRNVEVAVMLHQDGTPRLWRSARGSSMARALTTAATAARRRWYERERKMGSRLDELLPRMDVEVLLLREDGTLTVRDERFIDRVFTPVHGVAYENRNTWRYLLPAATRSAGGGSAARAYAKLFADEGLSASDLSRRDIRLYRLVATPLARSPAPQ